ncbi:type I-E CRISPR-associated protein Cse2/CasB [Alteromonas sp. A081]|uniref:type I-E CRISPR-associated protein Cse2/CasB n=1 Tax=Alteromonas sp. A081 TaxID=3410269 RepID=UPI003B98646C
MYKSILRALSVISKADKAELKRCSLKTLANSPAYFRVLAYSKAADSKQTQRILFLFLHTKLSDSDTGRTVAEALLAAGVKESQIIQLIRSGNNGVDYLKRQLVRCSNVNPESLGQLAQYWGDNARRQLLKSFILANSAKLETEKD